MKLVYRGVSYDYNPPQVAVEEGAVTGKFSRTRLAIP